MDTCERFDDGRALFTAVCELGFEGVVAKNHTSRYHPNDRGSVKVMSALGVRLLGCALERAVDVQRAQVGEVERARLAELALELGQVGLASRSVSPS